MPIRKNEIKRSRGDKEMDKKFSPSRNRDLIDLCKVTGLLQQGLAGANEKQVRFKIKLRVKTVTYHLKGI